MLNDLVMNFTHYDLGYKERGQIIEITLSGSAANVRLMDSANLQNYRSGRQHRYHGGLIKQSAISTQHSASITQHSASIEARMASPDW